MIHFFHSLIPNTSSLAGRSSQGGLGCSITPKYRLIKLKVLQRLHYSKTKLHKIFESVSSLWSDIFNCLSTQCQINIHAACNLAFFGCSGSTRALPSHQKQILRAGMVAAKNLISLNWKSPLPPCFRGWPNGRSGNPFGYCLMRLKLCVLCVLPLCP